MEAVRDLIANLKEAAALVQGENLVLVNQSFRRLFGLKGSLPPASELMAPFPEESGRFESRRLVPLEPPLWVTGVRIPLSPERHLLVLWEKDPPDADRDKIELMGRLAAEIAHELNNPLGGILLYANLLKEDLPPDSPLRDHVEKIVKLATRGRIIAKTVLSLAHPEEGPREVVDLNHLLREMYDLVSDYRVLRQVEPVWELAPEPIRTRGVRSQLERVILNLLINAGEAMEGRGRLFLRTGRRGREVFFEIRDTGPGIPEEIKERIFEPFFTTKRHGKGTGLGLSICHSIVNRHGGRIEVENLTPCGALFRIWLPGAEE
ncbi:sensor histidine kinase [Thermosulfurimonas sp. F29]|uniref:sensor histidine kinase n=1 Tax=Thermosulfurimonas sp. F29 TaxID=2867247 RepID=UPI001C838288|nr:HAMP domain-containing sensor histidine kinase [Thermosulfurimonas sp. F29]MBX6423951.1 HAMP domain-containing histidine kinase [Thermosulfurimonas sp. F29]